MASSVNRIDNWLQNPEILPDGTVAFRSVDDLWERVRGATIGITSPCIQTPPLNVRVPPCNHFDNIGAIQSKLDDDSKRLTQAQIDVMKSVLVEIRDICSDRELNNYMVCLHQFIEGNLRRLLKRGFENSYNGIAYGTHFSVKLVVPENIPIEFIFLYQTLVQSYSVFKGNDNYEGMCAYLSKNDPHIPPLLLCFIMATNETFNIYFDGRLNRFGVSIKLPHDLIAWFQDFSIHDFIEALSQKKNPRNWLNRLRKKCTPLLQNTMEYSDWKTPIDLPGDNLTQYATGFSDNRNFSPYFREKRKTIYPPGMIDSSLNECLFGAFQDFVKELEDGEHSDLGLNNFK